MNKNVAIPASKVLSDFAEIGIHLHDYSKPIYKYTSLETAKIILETSSIRFRAPSTFNDPFEFSLDFFDMYVSTKEFKERFDKVLRNQSDITSKKRKEILKNTTIDIFRKSYEATIEKQRHLVMVFCTSEVNDNILMWSHYANSHKGVCLGLKLPPLISSIDCLTMKVNYTDVIVPRKFYAADDHNRGLALMYWVYTKASCWGYEKEIRSFIKNDDNFLKIDAKKHCDIGLPKSQFQELYFGLEASEKDIQDIMQIIKQHDYNIPIIKKMKKVKGKFEMQAVAV